MSQRERRPTVLYAGEPDDTGTHPARVIETLGSFDVRIAETIEAARDAIETEPPACIVSRATLGDGTHRDLLTATDERVAAIPVVVVGPPQAVDHELLAEHDGRFVHEGETYATARTVVGQVRDLIETTIPSESSLAGFPAPAFVYDDGFVDWSEWFLAVVDRDPEWLAEAGFSDVFDRPSIDLAAAGEAAEPIDVEVIDSDGDRSAYRLSVGRDGQRYLGLLRESEQTDDTSPARTTDATILSSLMDWAPLAIYAKDRQGRHVAVSSYQVGMGSDNAIENPEGKRHHAPADVIGKTDFDLYPNRDAERFREIDERVMDDEQSHVERQHVELTPEGDNYAVTDVKVPWDDEGEVVGVVGVTIPVTESWRADRRATVRDVALGTITDIVRTQLRPALTAADGEDLHTDPFGRALTDVETLLETRQLPEATEAAELERHARNAWTALDADGPTLAVTTDSMVEAQPSLLEELFSELFENVAVHCGPNIEVRVGQLDDGFYVEDDGPGISSARRNEVLQYGTTADDRAGGGLAIVDAIAQAHDWSVTIKEGDKGGTRVAITGVVFH